MGRSFIAGLASVVVACAPAVSPLPSPQLPAPQKQQATLPLSRRALWMHPRSFALYDIRGYGAFNNGSYEREEYTALCLTGNRPIGVFLPEKNELYISSNNQVQLINPVLSVGNYLPMNPCEHFNRSTNNAFVSMPLRT